MPHEVVRHRTVVHPEFGGNGQQCVGEAVEQLLHACHDKDLKFAEKRLDDSFVRIMEAIRNGLTGAPLKEFATDQTLPLKKMCGCVMRSTLYCTHCKRCRRIFNSVTQIIFTIPNTLGIHTVQSALDRHFEWEPMIVSETVVDQCDADDDGCGLIGVRMKKLDLVAWPDVLILNIKRGLSVHRKDYRRLEFPYVLKLTQAPDIVYELWSVVVHVGDRPNRGHYIAYCRFGAEWFQFDDGSVKPAALSQVFYAQATLLLYVKS